MTAIVPFPTAAEPFLARSSFADDESGTTQAGPSQAAATRTGKLEGWAGPGRAPTEGDVAFRQLRHHTKNALQRILCQVAMQPGLTDTPAGRILARDMERRIHLVAAISDALFGFTRAPESLETRLQGLGRSVIELLSDPGQLIALDVAVDGLCPAALEETVVRVAHELIGNAVKHGMHVRLVGRIELRVRNAGGETRLTVADDGWGYAAQPAPGEGLSVARILAEQHGGEVRMSRERDLTHVTMVLPHRVGRRMRS
jgi:two-component sensor histidine kinase